jgi:small neutral amino acid transporter SnatA (MarC family)
VYTETSYQKICMTKYLERQRRQKMVKKGVVMGILCITLLFVTVGNVFAKSLVADLGDVRIYSMSVSIHWGNVFLCLLEVVPDGLR